MVYSCVGTMASLALPIHICLLLSGLAVDSLAVGRLLQVVSVEHDLLGMARGPARVCLDTVIDPRECDAQPNHDGDCQEDHPNLIIACMYVQVVAVASSARHSY